MTEEINYSYDGGLYAELIRNRTFRSDWSGILNWFLSRRGRPRRRSASIPRKGPRTALTNSAKLEVTKADANSPAGLLNEGYWGIAVRPNTRYTGSFFAKTASDGALPVTVALVADQSGQVLAKASVSGRRDGVEAVQVRDAVRERRRVLREPLRDDGRSARRRSGCNWSRCFRRLITAGPTAIASTSWRSWPRCSPRSCASPAATTWRAIASRRASIGRR